MNINNPDIPINTEPPFPLIPSEVGEYFLHKRRIYSLPDLQEVINQTTGLDVPPPTARPVIVWRIAEGRVFDLGDDQKDHLDLISGGQNQVDRALARHVTDRTERNHEARLCSDLGVRSINSAVI